MDVNEFFVDLRDKSDPQQRRGRNVAVRRGKEGWKILGWTRSFCSVGLYDDRITFEDAAEIIDAIRGCRTIKWRRTHSEDAFDEGGGAARRIKRDYVIEDIDICGPQTSADDIEGAVEPPTGKWHLDFGPKSLVQEGDFYVETQHREDGLYNIQCIFLTRIAGVMTVVAVYNSVRVL